jgi:hypothetical protein
MYPALNTKNLSDRTLPFVKFPRRHLGGARRRSRRSKLPLEKILVALGSTKIFGPSPIDLGGDVAGTGLPEQRDAS